MIWSLKSGSEVKGTVEFSQMGEEVMMMAYLSGLTPGEHAIHLHEKADCSSEDGKIKLEDIGIQHMNLMERGDR